MSALRHAALANLPVAGDELLIGGVPIRQLAARVGRTPFYAYDRVALERRIQQLRHVLPREVVLHYAIKANSMPAVVAHLSRLVDGLDVASGAELKVALDAGADPRQVSFAGPGKSERELEEAVAARILLNVESFREIRLLGEISKRLAIPARVAVRVNPDFELKSSGMKMGGGPKQFGIDAERVPEALSEAARCGLAFEGFHIFSGSQNLKHAAICEAQTNALELATRLAKDAPGPVKVLNLGGGFGIPYFPGEQSLALDPIGVHLKEIVRQAASSLPGAELVIELGRFIVGEAGFYVCRVIDRKESRGETFLVTDGGLHHHLAASGNFGQVIRKNYPVALGRSVYEGPREVASVVGPLCTPLDILGERVEIGVAEPGDLIVVFQSGAYGFSASPHLFLSHPAPTEVLV